MRRCVKFENLTIEIDYQADGGGRSSGGTIIVRPPYVIGYLKTSRSELIPTAVREHFSTSLR